MFTRLRTTGPGPSTSISPNGFFVDARRMPELTPGNPTNVQDPATGLVGQNYAMDNPSGSFWGQADNAPPT